MKIVREDGIYYVQTDDDEDLALDDILDEIDPNYLVSHLASRERIERGDDDDTRKLITKLLGLPGWYASDKKRILEEAEGLF
jgi:hypothetical protein